jgi:hypothetical protein
MKMIYEEGGVVFKPGFVILRANNTVLELDSRGRGVSFSIEMEGKMALVLNGTGKSYCALVRGTLKRTYITNE